LTAIASLNEPILPVALTALCQVANCILLLDLTEVCP
jgi:uncharacterized protein (UPF0276 family)